MTPSRLDVRVLGPVEVSASDKIVDLGGARQRRLFAALLVQSGRTVHALELADAVWADDDQPANVDNSLRTYVSRLRRVLSDAGVESTIHTEARGYRMELDGCLLDAEQLSELYAAARAHHESGDLSAAVEFAEQALGLWRGRPYGPFTDEPWLAGEVRRLDELYLNCVEERAEVLLALGHHEHLIGELKRQCADHPQRERLHGQLMVALYRSGRQSDALRAFESYRRALAEETGLEPGGALREIEQRITRGDKGLLVPDHNGLPLRSYRLLERAGTGSFAVVWRGTQPSLGRDVAIKQIRAELANNPEFIRRFEAEAHVVARLEHPYIVPLYDYWRELGVAYLVMRWLRGGTLEDRIAEQPLSLEECVRLVTEVGAALSHAHRAGVVHRDVKPANVLLDGDGNFFLGDFGIALAPAESIDPGWSPSAGSPAYASPEQLRREPVGPAADVFGLAIVAYEALTGALPFPEEHTPAGLLQRQLNEPIPLVGRIRPDVPAEVDEALQQATAKDPAVRTATVADFIAQFTAAAHAATGGSGRGQRAPGVSTRLSGISQNPYKGLRAFTEADAADFFGRSRLTDRLLDRLRRQGPAGRLLAVVGPSGSGKSSVVRAGLLTAVRSGRIPGSQQWLVTGMVPGAHPYEELASALARVASDRSSSWMLVFSGDERGLARAVKQLLPDEQSELLLVVDQFEELFTLCADVDERRRFVGAVADAVSDPRSRVRVVLSLRADFWDRPLRYPELAALLDEANVPVGPLAPDELERAIVDPAARVGVDFEPGLVSKIVADVADQPGALPMLQYALTELFERQVSGLLTLDAYRQLGGVVGALARRAEELYATATAEEQTAARRLFNRLVTLGEGVEDTRRRVIRSELGGDAATDTVIDRFGAARLLSFDRDPLTREPTVEVAHEALIREWPRLRNWLDEDREGLRIHRHLTDASRAWEGRGRDPGDLYRGGRLDAAQEWASTRPGEANPLEVAFLDASIMERQRAQDDLRRTNRRLRALLSGVGVALVLALVAGGLALVQQRRARAAQVTAEREAARRAELQASSELRRLVAESKVAQTTDMSVSLLLAAEANRRADTPATRGALLSALVSNPRVLAKWYGEGRYLDADLSTDGTLLAARHVDGTVELWDTATGRRRESRLTVGTEAERASISLSPDARQLASADESATIGVWDVASGTRRATLPTVGSTVPKPPVRFGRRGELFYGDKIGRVWRVPADLTGTAERVASAPAEIAQLTISRDDTTLLAVDVRFNVTVVDLTGSQTPRTFATGLNGAVVTQVGLNPDASRIAIGVGGQGRGVFDVTRGEAVATYSDQNNAMQAFSGDGSVLTSFGSGLLLLADPGTGAARQEPFPILNAVASASLASPDGSRLYVVSATNEIAVVDLIGRTKLGSPLPPDIGFRAQYSPDGRRLGVGRLDGSVAIVDPETGHEFAVLRPPNAVPVPPATQNLNFDFSPDGNELAVGGFAGSVTIFDIVSGSVRRVIPVPYEPPDSSFAPSFGPLAQGYVGQVSWSPDGRSIATGGFDAVSVFDAKTGERRFRTKGFKNLMTCSWFSPDSRLISGCSFDGTAWILDAATGERVGPPLGTGNFEPIITAWWVTDGHRIAMTDARENTVRIIDVATRAQVGPTYRPGDAPHLPQVTPDGSTLVSSSVSGDISLTDIATGQVIGEPIKNASLNAIFLLRPDGKALVAGGPGRQSIWDIDPESWKHKACKLAGRNLTSEEWKTHLPDDPYRPICPQWPSP